MRHVTPANLIWLTLYIAMMAAITWLLVDVRERAVVDLSSREAQVDWNQWRDAAKKQATSGPVRRRTPGRSEPPALVLLRDHFPVLIIGSLVLSSLLFGTTMFFLRGAYSQSRKENPRS